MRDNREESVLKTCALVIFLLTPLACADGINAGSECDQARAAAVGKEGPEGNRQGQETDA
jgi:hypothetical protein